MWFTKQRDALPLCGFVIAEDISAHGHKRYGVISRDNVDNFIGPYCELIRVDSLCKLYFDLDGPATTPVGVVDEVIEAVNARLFEQYGIQGGNVIVLCSSSNTKFSKHLIFPNVFRNNWSHMRNFVMTIDHELIDHSVYSRNRCFRMAGCHKYGDHSRIFRPGLPSGALVQVTEADIVLEFNGQQHHSEHHAGGHQGVAIGAFNMKTLVIPPNWNGEPKSLEPDDLLTVISPDQVYHAFFAIGCAYKRAGGSCDFFCNWCKDHRMRSGVIRQWRCWNRTGKGYGYPFLKEVAFYFSSTDECSMHLNEAFGFHPSKYPVNVINFSAPYVTESNVTNTKCVLIKSPTGTGKSTVARQIAQRFSHKRILYIVSSRSLAYGARNSLNEMTKIGHSLQFASYLESNTALWEHNHLVCSIQSLWRAYRLKRVNYDLIICDELTSVIEDMTNVTNKHPKENQEAFRWFSKNSKRWIGLDAHLMDTSLTLCTDYFDNIDVIINHHICPRKDAVFIPRPQWSTLNKIRSKASAPNASLKDVTAFSDATCMYDLLFQCWSNSVKTFFICNNVRLGNWVEENYLRRSFTWMALMWAGLCDDLAVLVTDFCCKGDNTLQRRQFKYEWIHKGDGRDGSAFKSLDWWSKIDHLQYTLKICAGIDFNPKIPHYGVGFCYSTPNTAVPRRVLQQTGRIRKYAPNSLYEHPTIFFAIGDRVTVKHLPVVGFDSIKDYANKQSSGG